MKPFFSIKTFGCKVNYYDSLLIQQELDSLGPLQQKNIVILNSCAVTAQAGKEIRKEAEKIKSSDPESLVVVTGCGAQVETELYKNNSFVDLVVGNSDKKNLNRILQDYSPDQKNKVFKSNIFKSFDSYSEILSSDPKRTRAFLKIQDGCNSFCTFCIIPFARGRSKSIPSRFLVEAVKTLEDQGVKEVVLTGVHIGEYRDENKNLEDLLFYILKKTKIPRLRLTSLEPIEITDRLLEVCKSERICPHFHISLQSASSPVLKSMKRNYNQKDIEVSFQKLDRAFPGAFIGMDVIAGFPSESQEDFEETYDFLKDQPWTQIHVFPYSARTGTYAAKYKNLCRSTVIKRAGLLRHLSDIRFQNEMERQRGTSKKVLIFKHDKSQGLSRDYWKVKLPDSLHKGEREVFIQDVDKEKNSLKGCWL